MRPDLEQIITEIEKVIVGKRSVIEKMLMAILAQGHILLDDVPGVGKTTLAIAFSKVLGLPFQRIQFTPDVLASDIVGFTFYEKQSGEFAYHPGAISSASLVLGDEINRASSKVQSALLEAMEERQITVDGKTYTLADPFLVIATQNRVGTAGTQPLPFAQMDRFMVCLSVGYPDREAQMSMLQERQNGNPMDRIRRMMDQKDLHELQNQVKTVVSKEPVLDYITRLVMASREHGMVEVGVSPRGALFLDQVAKARALMMGRDYVTGADVREVFSDVCSHRMLVNRKGRTDDMTVSQVLQEILEQVEDPDHRSIR